MARFYAVFDPATTSTELGDAGYQKVYIGANAGTSAQLSASAALLRDGLIVSRSALSTAMYAQMDSANIDGSKGIIIPYDSITRTGGNLNFDNVYTSSITGVVIPPNYSTRPTDAFISASDPRLYATGDTGTISDSLYANAASAVDTILRTKIQAAVGNTTNYGPYSAQSIPCVGKENNMLVSIFHNETLDYFGWDSYLPPDANVGGTALGGPYTGPASKPRNQDFNFNLTLNSSFKGNIFIEIAELIGPAPSTTVYQLKAADGVTNLRNNAWPVGPGPASIAAKIPANALAAGDYGLRWFAFFRDETFSTCFSPCSALPESGNDCYYSRIAPQVWLTLT